ncbi:DNA polymerase III subunit delta [Limoniibacter endophyticus]|uniref:DNA polymerase III subunit delta n=1 Tax=Limoniibacter endophyticus TaxID=1565040 RepID=A0A8J3GGQ8_9HYPH|nr:DNA polymerase III subunit delta [Limoniibacter endophyticus]GHC74328.1 DNA polymerase III subunit delta [Limoniibacter endophyticus]
MSEKKAHEVDSWLSQGRLGEALYLVYGPDRGLVSERARMIAALTKVPLDDPFSVTRLEASEIEQDLGRLMDEVKSVAMFADRKLVWIRNAGTHKGFAETVKLVLSEPISDCVIIIEAGELKKGAALRASVENAKIAMALPCYADEGQAIDRLIETSVQAANKTISMEARQLLRQNLGGDRLASRGEIEKLLLYAGSDPQVTIEHINALSADSASVSADDVIDAMLEGKVNAFDLAFARLSANSNQAANQLLGSALRQFHALLALRGKMEQDRVSSSSAVAGARPPIFFSRRKLFERTVERWDSVALTRALRSLQAAVLRVRQRQDLSVAATRHALLALTLEAARRMR